VRAEPPEAERVELDRQLVHEPVGDLLGRMNERLAVRSPAEWCGHVTVWAS